MNRRELLAAGGAGVVGFFLPRKLEAAVSAELVLHGLTDLQMAQKIGDFPLASFRLDYSFSLKDQSKNAGFELRNFDEHLSSSIVIHGTEIVVNTDRIDPRAMGGSGKESNQWLVRVEDQNFIRFRESYFTDVSKGLFIMTQYRRLAVAGGFGWFTLHKD